jgi:tetratricopeptide (TPR) repeat protein
MQQIKIFVSSPSDASHERLRIDRVVQRLNSEFSNAAHLQAYRWETEFYQAHETFQAQIPQAADCDIVIAIFRGRLGTELPPDFARMPDGSPYASGTAYELLTAMTARRERGAPDVYVFRCSEPPMIRLDDPNARQIEDEWNRLKQFFDTWFLTRDGHFTGAFQTFTTTDDFDGQLTRLLRGRLEETVRRGRAVSWPIEALGSPFRGLAAFGAKHAPVFFGRPRDIGRALEAWRHAAEAGIPFLLVVGASGAGKSSLARAGLIPRLTTPGVVSGVDAWRVAALRPSEIAGGPITTLATRLFDEDSDIPEEESGRPRALPELAEGDHREVASLAALFRQAPEAAVGPVVRALERVGVVERDRGSYDRPVRADLVLLVDQLDELFTVSISAEERAAFVRVLQVLVETGRVWLVATLRADLYELFLAEPPLLLLKNQGASYDLVPPGPAQLAEIVRKPAEAAGLVFEADPATGESLDEKLLRDLDRPDMLPLLQLMLNGLFENRVSDGDEVRLTLAAERELGGLAGVIEREGEAALSGLGDEEIAALPRLLRRLAAIGGDPDRDPTGSASTITIRTVPLSRAADTDASRRLIQALLEERLLLTSGEGAAAGIRLAHERVLLDWQRARELVAANAEFYRVRNEIEEAQRRWEGSQQSNDLLIPRGLPLAEAEAVLGRFGEELAPAARDFVIASGRRARRRQRLSQAAAVLFAVLAVAASLGGLYADYEQRQARRSFDAAKQAVHVIVTDVVTGLSNVQGIETARMRTVLDDIRQTVQGLVQQAPNDADIKRLDLEMQDQFASIYLAVNDLERAQSAATDALERTRSLAAQDPDPQWQRSIAVSLTKIGEIKLRRGDSGGALRSYEEAVDTERRLLESKPGNGLWRADLASTLSGLGDVKAQMGDPAGALVTYDEALPVVRWLVEVKPDDQQLKGKLAELLSRIANIERQRGGQDNAYAEYAEAIAITRDLTRREPGDLQWQRSLSRELGMRADLAIQQGKLNDALADYKEALMVTRRAADADPSNAEMRWEVAAALLKTGDAQTGAGQREAGAAAFSEALDIMRRLTARDPGNRQWQRDLSVTLNKVGDIKLAGGDTADASACYDEALAIVQRLAEKYPEDATWLRDVAVGFDKVGNLKLRSSEMPAAIAYYQRALASIQQLLRRDAGNANWQRDAAVTLNKIADAKLASGDPSWALAAFEEARRIVAGLVERNPDNARLQTDLAFTMNRIGDARLRAQDQAGARSAFETALQIARQLAEHDPTSTVLQTSLVADLYRIAQLEQGEKRDETLQEALAILERLQRETKLSGEQAAWPAMIRAMLSTGTSAR